MPSHKIHCLQARKVLGRDWEVECWGNYLNLRDEAEQSTGENSTMGNFLMYNLDIKLLYLFSQDMWDGKKG